MTTSWPDLTALPGVAVAVESARDAVAALALHPRNRRGWATSASAAAIRAARASAALDGGSVGVDSSEEWVSDPVLAGSIRCQAAVGTLAGVFGRAPLQAIARLHTLAAADLIDAADLGRPRADPQVSSRLSALAAVVTGSRWPAPIVMAVVHAELLVIRPFDAANGVVARAAARLAMVHSGLDPHALGVPEVAYLRAGSRYQELVDDYAVGGPDALAAWIRFVCGALQSGVREGRSIADASG